MHQPYAGYKKIVRFKKTYKFTAEYFSIGVVSLFLFIKNIFMKIKNSFFAPKYTRNGKYVKKQNYLFYKKIQLCCWPFFHRSHIFRLVMKRIIFKGKCGFKIVFNPAQSLSITQKNYRYFVTLVCLLPLAMCFLIFNTKTCLIRIVFHLISCYESWPSH